MCSNIVHTYILYSCLQQPNVRVLSSTHVHGLIITAIVFKGAYMCMYIWHCPLHVLSLLKCTLYCMRLHLRLFENKVYNNNIVCILSLLIFYSQKCSPLSPSISL